MSFAVLDPSFFAQNPFDPAFAKKWERIGKWHEHFFPIYEWDGMVYVAFSGDQPGKVKKVIPVVFVQCDAETLARAFRGEKSESPSQPAALQAAPDGLELFSSPEPVEEKTEVSVSTQMASEMPDGLSLQTQPSIFAELEAPPAPKSTARIERTATSPSMTLSSHDIEDIFQKMTFHFSKAMLLRVDGDQALPVKWSGTFVVPKNPTPVTFETPSPFRIAFKTQKPFHGKVHASPVGDMFFNEWNAGSVPDHLTIVPILQEERLIGFLLGMGNHESSTRLALAATEKLARTASTLLAA